MRVITYLALALSLPALIAGVWRSTSHGAEKKASTATLQETMEELASTFRKVRRQVKNPEQNEATLTQLAKMETLALKAKSMVPKQVTALPKEKQGDAQKAFRLKMIQLLTTFLQAEKAILEARNGDAYTLVKKMGVLSGECHTLMGVGQ
jgi:hypothetical protein